MKIKIAKSAGFCMGVKRAVDMVLDATNHSMFPVYTYGPLIHNPQVLKLLEEKGVSIIDDIPQNGSGTVLIRAHGVPPEIKSGLNQAGFEVIDATCPRVIKVQSIIKKHAKQGYSSIIIGDEDHPEVIGLLGYSLGKGYVVNNLNALKDLPPFDLAIIVAQTTQSTLLYEEVKSWTNQYFPHYKVFETICDSTQSRQAEVSSLSKSVDAIIVVGGRNSGNTQRLTEIAMKSGKPVYHIENESEIDVKAVSSAKSIGITAGASTPNWIINKAYRTLELLIFSRKRSWFKIFFFLQQILLRSNLYVSLGAGCLCYACGKLQGISPNFPFILISMLYVLSMHTFNNLTGRKADRYNDPDRAAFYSRYKIILMIIAPAAGITGLIIAYTLGNTPFYILLTMSIMGMLYNLKLFPKYYKYQKLRDFPGSKTILIAIAWGIATSLLPSIAKIDKINLTTATVFLWSTGIVFVRTSLFDIMDMQGDRIIGRETLPILLGEKKTLRFLKIILEVLALIILLSSYLKITTSLGVALTFASLYTFMVLSALEKGYIPPGIRMEFLIEIQFVIMGIITFVMVQLLAIN